MEAQVADFLPFLSTKKISMVFVPVFQQATTPRARSAFVVLLVGKLA
jgi:hypothetical protein